VLNLADFASEMDFGREKLEQANAPNNSDSKRTEGLKIVDKMEDWLICFIIDHEVGRVLLPEIAIIVDELLCTNVKHFMRFCCARVNIQITYTYMVW